LARQARIESIVTRSISRHLTERMHDHYSTVAADEQRESIAKVIDLFGGGQPKVGSKAGLGAVVLPVVLRAPRLVRPMKKPADAERLTG
jgi:hypothetical protein